MTGIVTGRQTVVGEQPMVVVLIGARINNWWLLPIALPILGRMRAMQQELLADPESGLLAIQSFGPGGDVQYWRSIDHLLAYARDEQREHVPAMRRFWKKIFKNQAVGVWHEIFVVAAGHYEGMYVNMPPKGLGRIGPLQPAEGHLKTTRDRLSVAVFEKGPVEPIQQPHARDHVA